jgi:hypothetical protein
MRSWVDELCGNLANRSTIGAGSKLGPLDDENLAIDQHGWVTPPEASPKQRANNFFFFLTRMASFS